MSNGKTPDLYALQRVLLERFATGGLLEAATRCARNVEELFLAARALLEDAEANASVASKQAADAPHQFNALLRSAHATLQAGGNPEPGLYQAIRARRDAERLGQRAARFHAIANLLQYVSSALQDLSPDARLSHRPFGLDVILSQIEGAGPLLASIVGLPKPLETATDALEVARLREEIALGLPAGLSGGGEATQAGLLYPPSRAWRERAAEFVEKRQRQRRHRRARLLLAILSSFALSFLLVAGRGWVQTRARDDQAALERAATLAANDTTADLEAAAGIAEEIAGRFISPKRASAEQNSRTWRSRLEERYLAQIEAVVEKALASRELRALSCGLRAVVDLREKLPGPTLDTHEDSLRLARLQVEFGGADPLSWAQLEDLRRGVEALHTLGASRVGEELSTRARSTYAADSRRRCSIRLERLVDCGDLEGALSALEAYVSDSTALPDLAWGERTRIGLEVALDKALWAETLERLELSRSAAARVCVLCTFLRKYERSAFRGEAQGLLRVAKIEADDEAFAYAARFPKDGSLYAVRVAAKGLERYLQERPNGRHVSSARKLLGRTQAYRGVLAAIAAGQREPFEVTRVINAALEKPGERFTDELTQLRQAWKRVRVRASILCANWESGFADVFSDPDLRVELRCGGRIVLDTPYRSNSVAPTFNHEGEFVYELGQSLEVRVFDVDVTCDELLGTARVQRIGRLDGSLWVGAGRVELDVLAVSPVVPAQTHTSASAQLSRAP